QQLVAGIVAGEFLMDGLDAADLRVSVVGESGGGEAEVGEVGAVGVHGDPVEVVVQIGDRLVERVYPPHPGGADLLALVFGGEQEVGGGIDPAAGGCRRLDQPGVAAGVIVA